LCPMECFLFPHAHQTRIPHPNLHPQMLCLTQRHFPASPAPFLFLPFFPGLHCVPFHKAVQDSPGPLSVRTLRRYTDDNNTFSSSPFFPFLWYDKLSNQILTEVLNGVSIRVSGWPVRRGFLRFNTSRIAGKISGFVSPRVHCLKERCVRREWLSLFCVQYGGHASHVTHVLLFYSAPGTCRRLHHAYAGYEKKQVL